MKNKLKYLPCITTLAVMIIIFIFSSQNAEDSSQTSTGFMQFIINIVNSVFNTCHSPSLAQEIDFFVRKAAHFSIFARLGLNVCWMLVWLREYITKSNAVLASAIFCFIYACTDEMHQLFSSGRSCRFADVILDTAGGIFGAICFLILIWIIKISHKRR